MTPLTADELRERRERMGLSQAQLGLAIDKPQNTISRWERGEIEIAGPRMLRVVLDLLEDDLARERPARASLASWLRSWRNRPVLAPHPN